MRKAAINAVSCKILSEKLGIFPWDD